MWLFFESSVCDLELLKCICNLVGVYSTSRIAKHNTNICTASLSAFICWHSRFCIMWHYVIFIHSSIDLSIHQTIHPLKHLYILFNTPPHTHKLLYRYLWCILYTNACIIDQPVLPNHTCNTCICFLVCFHSFLALRCMWALTCAQRPWRETSAPCIWRRRQSMVGANRKDVTIQVQFKVLN